MDCNRKRYNLFMGFNYSGNLSIMMDLLINIDLDLRGSIILYAIPDLMSQ